MKGTWSILTITALLVLFAASPASAGDRGLGAGLFLGYERPEGAEEGALYIGADLEKRFLKLFGLRLEAGWRRDMLPIVEMPGFNVKVVTSSVPLLLSLVFHPLGESLLSPYLIGGGGAYFRTNKVKVDIAGIPLVDASESETVGGTHIGVGLEVNPSDHLAIKGDVRWVFLGAVDVDNVDFSDLENQTGEDVADEKKADGVWLTLGATLYF